MSPPTFNVAILIYPHADILDFCGPLEIYTASPPPSSSSDSNSDSSSSPSYRPFNTTTFAATNPVKISRNALTIVPDASVEDIDSDLSNYDIIVVPGAWPQDVKDFNNSDDGKKVLALLKRFSSLPPRKETGHRVVQSVCTGALVLAASGILAGKTITTHHMSYDDLKEIADKSAGGDAHVNVVKKRWVDAGLTEAGVRIVNAGGVTSGIDMSLYVVEMLVGKEHAEWTASLIEYERRENNGWES